jgi:hypothetical protein
MKNKAVITGVKIAVDGNMHDYFDGFYVKGVNGAIDPFVDDNFSKSIEDLDCSEQVEWARKQVGKTLFYDELIPCGYYTHGKSYIA